MNEATQNDREHHAEVQRHSIDDYTLEQRQRGSELMEPIVKQLHQIASEHGVQLVVAMRNEAPDSILSDNELEEGERRFTLAKFASDDFVTSLVGAVLEDMHPIGKMFLLKTIFGDMVGGGDGSDED